MFDRMSKIIYVFFVSLFFYHYTTTGEINNVSKIVSSIFTKNHVYDKVPIFKEDNVLLIQNSTKKLTFLNETVSFITNGHLATNGQLPYQVGILMKEGGKLYFICGGSILNESFVVTAAHCKPGDNEYYIITGDIDRESPNIQKFKVENFIVRPGFHTHTLQGDIALIKIKGTFWSEKPTDFIKPIPLIDYEIEDETECIVSGWGKTEDSREASKILRYVKLSLLPTRKCIAKNRHSLYGMICLASKTYAVCYGDSGGPAAVKGKLAGIASWIKGTCGDGKHADVFTDVYYYRNWILYNHQSTKNSLSLERLMSIVILLTNFYLYYPL